MGSLRVLRRSPEQFDYRSGALAVFGVAVRLGVLEGDPWPAGNKEKMIICASAVVVAFFCAKILWNLAIPYRLAAWPRSDEEKGISLMPMLEVLLLGIALLLSLVDQWPWNPARIALIGALVIVGSYIHFLLAGMLAGWLASKIRGPK